MHDATQIQNALPVDPKEILQDAFLDGLMNGTDKNTSALINNLNHYDFTSTSPLLLVGTKGDLDLPYHGAEIAYEVLKQKSDQVYIKSVSDTLDHLQAFPYVLKEELAFFQQYN
jgi:hypothetical protein